MATTNPAPTTHQGVVDQLSALEPKYEAMRKADEKRLQQACGDIGHVIKTSDSLIGLGNWRHCVVCGAITEDDMGGA